MTSSHGPHQSIPLKSERERFLAELLDALWDRYRERVAYVRTYEQVIRQANASFVNDHVAFRTFASQQPATGIFSIARVFEALGYQAAGNYQFPDKNLSATHFQHPNGKFPKIFVSELRTWELPTEAQEIVGRTLRSHRPQMPDKVLTGLALLDGNKSQRDALLQQTIAHFTELPWLLPRKDDLLALNQHSQYAAWVLVHGYNVNHFTSLVNSHGIDALNQLEGTIAALQKAGVPMKSEIEGAPGSKLRQSATEAVQIDVDVLDHGNPMRMPWTYAYFELAERNEVLDPQTGNKVRFEGFLGPQATNLFEMTRVKAT